jgi:hypothetical protein
MIRNLFLLIFTISSLSAADLTNFDVRQTVLQDVKKIVQNEESIARAYEQYIIDNKAIPSTIAALYTTTGDYLGSSSEFLKVITSSTINATYFNTFTLGLSKISYALKGDLKSDSTGIKALYESNTFRKRTYYRNNEIYFVLEDTFAKHLFDLIQQKGSGLSTCSGLANISCIKNNHIYIKPTYTSGDITGYLMNYHVDNFTAGPIVITNNTSLHSNSEFKSIPKGALLIDTTGVRYVKTTTSIEALK